MNAPESTVDCGGGPGTAFRIGWGPLSNAAGPRQETSFGPKAVKVTVPLGAPEPVTPVMVASSEIGPPITAVGVAWVAMATAPWTTMDVSLASLQALPIAG